MIIAVKEDTKLGTEYSTLKDDNGKACKFKTISEAEERLKTIFETNPAASFILLNG